MIALGIIACVVLFLLILLLSPVRVQARLAEETFSLKIRYLFLRFPVLPAKEKPEGEPEKKKKKKEKPKAETGEKKPSFFKRLKAQHGLSGLLHLAVELAKLATSTLKNFFSHIVVYHLHAEVRIASDDAAQTAITHSKVCTILDASMAVVAPLIPPKKRRDIQYAIYPDFTTEEGRVSLFADVGIRPLFVITTVFGALIRFLCIYLTASKNSKAEKSSEEQIKEPTTEKAV